MRRLLAILVLVLSLLSPVALPIAAQQKQAVQRSDQTHTVYITRTGKRYHRDGSRYLSMSKIPISLKDTKTNGYTRHAKCAIQRSDRRRRIVEKYTRTWKRLEQRTKPEEPHAASYPYLSPELAMRIEAIRAAVAEVCPISAEQWLDGFNVTSILNVKSSGGSA